MQWIWIEFDAQNSICALFMGMRTSSYCSVDSLTYSCNSAKYYILVALSLWPCFSLPFVCSLNRSLTINLNLAYGWDVKTFKSYLHEEEAAKYNEGEMEYLPLVPHSSSQSELRVWTHWEVIRGNVHGVLWSVFPQFIHLLGCVTFTGAVDQSVLCMDQSPSQ